eukprot:5262648-Karenia_brevis.AAC.1
MPDIIVRIGTIVDAVEDEDALPSNVRAALHQMRQDSAEALVFHPNWITQTQLAHNHYHKALQLHLKQATANKKAAEHLQMLSDKQHRTAYRKLAKKAQPPLTTL